MFYPIYIRIMRKTHLFELDAAEKLDYGMFLTRTAKTTQKCNVWKWFSITLWVRVWLENSIHFLLIYTGMFLVYIFQVSQIFHMRIRYAQLTAQTQHKEYLLVHIGISIYILWWMAVCLSLEKRKNFSILYVYGHARKFIRNWSALRWL